MEMIILPRPRSIQIRSGIYVISESTVISASCGNFDEIFFSLRKLKSACAGFTGFSLMISKKEYQDGIRFIHDSNLKDQEYKISCDASGIMVVFNKPCSAFYAVTTLKQIITQCGNEFPHLEISDYPDFNARGVLIDISRGKIPTMDFLYSFIDMISEIKYNEIQFYVEGRPFAYESLKQYWENYTPITGEEIVLLDKYCKERFVDFVPNINSFGHNAYWLAQPEFHDFAECPDGFDYGWTIGAPMTLCPTDRRSVEFIDRLYNDMLPYYSSKNLNVGCDETMECGKGRSAIDEPDKTPAQIYLDYIIKIHELTKKHDKRMMMWGDIILQHPEHIKDLPGDIIVMDWGYEEFQDFVESTAKFKEAGLSFYVCPGTSGWCAIGGSDNKSEVNQRNAARNGIKNGAVGFLLTDWADVNINMPYVVYPAMIYGGAISWCLETNENVECDPYLDKFVFCDINNESAALARLLANSYRHYKTFIWNNTWTLHMLHRYPDPAAPFTESKYYTIEECEAVLTDARTYLEKLPEIKLMGPDADILYREMKLTGEVLWNITEYTLLRKLIFEGADTENIKVRVMNLKEAINTIIPEYESLWLKRNRQSDLESSVRSNFTRIIEWADTIL